MTITEAVRSYDDVRTYLMYRAYAFNRVRNPEVAPHEWASIFPWWDRLEAMYHDDPTCVLCGRPREPLTEVEVDHVPSRADVNLCRACHAIGA